MSPRWELITRLHQAAGAELRREIIEAIPVEEIGWHMQFFLRQLEVEENADVRTAMVRKVASVPCDEIPVLAYYVFEAACCDADAAVRKAGIEAFGVHRFSTGLADSVLSQVVVDDEDPRTREAAIDSLMKIGSFKRDAVWSIEDALDDSDDDVRRIAIHGIFAIAFCDNAET